MTDLPLVAVVGPTASGKSDLAVELALRLGGEVVNTDAMQLYRGMDIGTAKLTVEQRRGVPHHLLDVLDVTEQASVAEFQRWARDVILDIWTRGRQPVLVGGSGLYVRAVVDRISFPGTDPQVRARLEAEAAQLGLEALHERLRALDPEAAASILPTRRLVSARRADGSAIRSVLGNRMWPWLWPTPPSWQTLWRQRSETSPAAAPASTAASTSSSTLGGSREGW